MARPTKYNPELVSKAKDYLRDYESLGHVMPSIVGLARHLNVGKSTLYEWAAKEENEFTDILAHCNEEQEFTLFNKALKNEINSNIAKLALGKHGYSDRQATELTGADGTSLIPESITVKYE